MTKKKSKPITEPTTEEVGVTDFLEMAMSALAQAKENEGPTDPARLILLNEMYLKIENVRKFITARL